MAEAESFDPDGFGDWPDWDGLQSAVWDQSAWRRLSGAMQLVGSAAAVLTLIGGTPALLMMWGGWPLTDFPWMDELESLPLTPETQQLILVLGGAAAWGSWAAFTVGVLGQVRARLRRNSQPPGSSGAESGLGGGRPLALRLIEAAAAGLAALRSPGGTPQDADAAAPSSPSPKGRRASRAARAEADAQRFWAQAAAGNDEAEHQPKSSNPDIAPNPDTGTDTETGTDTGADTDPDSDAKPAGDAQPTDEGAEKDERPSRTMTAVVSSAGHLTLSPWRIGVGTRWSGTRVRVVQAGLHVEIYDPEDRLIRSLEIDPDRRYQPSGNSPGPQPR